MNGSASSLLQDPWKKYYKVPDWLSKLIDKGLLGQKTGAGIYISKGKQFLNPKIGVYENAGAKPDQIVQIILNIKNPAERLYALRISKHPHAQFLWSIHLDVFHHAVVLLAEIADNARDVDFAIRWGYGWTVGPFEMWQSAGWKQVSVWISDDIAAGKALADVPLPDWVWKLSMVHEPRGSYSAAENTYKQRSPLPVYQRQLYPEQVLGEIPHQYGETIFTNDMVRLWTTGDDIGILSFNTKCNIFMDSFLGGILEALQISEQRFIGLIIWQIDAQSGTGINLLESVTALRSFDCLHLENIMTQFQRTTAAIRYSTIPVIGAAQGKLISGYCEILMHCDCSVVALESYMGLIESGVGIMPWVVVRNSPCEHRVKQKVWICCHSYIHTLRQLSEYRETLKKLVNLVTLTNQI
jgi:3-hydroxyacyl-CoA dehydrogenase